MRRPLSSSDPARRTRASRRLGLFVRREDGATTVETVLLLMPLLMLLMTVAEVSIGYYTMQATNKAAQLGARLAVSRDPIHQNVWETNRLIPANGQIGDACFAPSGSDPCQDPGMVWSCTYTSGALSAGCDTANFNGLITQMRRLNSNIDPEDVTVEYIYRRLGQAGQDFTPEVRVTVAARSLHVNLLSFVGLLTIREAVASNFGEDMSS
ncbi:MAG: TadE/TadG family type IV pilus assembly protein [Pseudomonadota bacterium]